MTDVQQLRFRIQDQGFTVIQNLLPPHMIVAILDSLGDTTHSQRNLLANPAIADVAEFGVIPNLVESILGTEAFAVRAILFDKIEGANWKVPWHQDLIIPVREKRETPGFSGWSVKDGIPHAHPPDEVLAGMLTVRLHLDECGPDNGPLRVLPGSHRHGKLTPDTIHRLRAETEPVVCAVPAGGRC